MSELMEQVYILVLSSTSKCLTLLFNIHEKSKAYYVLRGHRGARFEAIGQIGLRPSLRTEFAGSIPLSSDVITGGIYL